MIKEDLLKTEMIWFNHNISDVPSEHYQLHCHNEFELYYLMGGDVEYLVEGCEYRMKSDSMLLIGANIFHGVKVNSTKPYHRTSIHFFADMLDPVERELLLTPFRQPQICYFQVDRYRLNEFVQSVLECREMERPLQDIALKSRVIALLTQIYAMYHAGYASTTKSDQQVQQIIALLNESLSAPISLEHLAKQFFISKNHLNTIFRKATGTTVGNYIIHKRVALAQKYIQEGKPAAEAASAAGFQDYSNFYRAYRKIVGTSPSGLSVS